MIAGVSTPTDRASSNAVLSAPAGPKQDSGRVKAAEAPAIAGPGGLPPPEANTTPGWAYLALAAAVGLALGVFLLSESMKVDALLSVQVASSAPGNGWLPVRATLREGMAEGQWVPSALPVVVELVSGQKRLARTALKRNSFGEFEGELDLHRLAAGSYVFRAVSPLRSALLIELPFQVLANPNEARRSAEQGRRAMPTEILRVERLHPERLSGLPQDETADALREIVFDGGACVPGRTCRAWVSLAPGWSPRSVEPETALQWRWSSAADLHDERMRSAEIEIEGPEARVVATFEQDLPIAHDTTLPESQRPGLTMNGHGQASQNGHGQASQNGPGQASQAQSYLLWLPVALGSPHVVPRASRIAIGRDASFTVRNEVGADAVVVDAFVNGVWRRARSCAVRVGQPSECSIGPMDELGTWLFQFYSAPTRTADASSQRVLVVPDVKVPAVATLERDLARGEGVTVDLPASASTFARSSAELQSTKQNVRLAVFLIILCSALFVLWHFWTRSLQASRLSLKIEQDGVEDNTTSDRQPHVPLSKAVPLLLATISIALALASALLVLVIRS